MNMTQYGLCASTGGLQRFEKLEMYCHAKRGALTLREQLLFAGHLQLQAQQALC